MAWLAATQSFFATVTLVSLVRGDPIASILRAWVHWTTSTTMPMWMLGLTTPPAIVGFLAGAALRQEERRPWLPLSVAAAVAASIPAVILGGYSAARM